MFLYLTNNQPVSAGVHDPQNEHDEFTPVPLRRLRNLS
jgi:hypothetical protein